MRLILLVALLACPLIARATSNRAFRDLEETFPHVVRGLEHGFIEAHEHFDLKSLPFDAAPFYTLVRLHAREYLRSRQISAGEVDASVSEGPADLAIEKVNLCGLWLRVGRYHLKIWKISAHDLAKALKALDHGKQLPLVDDEGIPISIVDDLAIFWTAEESQELGKLYLVQATKNDPRCRDWIWSREIVPLKKDAEVVKAGDVHVEDAAVETNESNR